MAMPIGAIDGSLAVICGHKLKHNHNELRDELNAKNYEDLETLKADMETEKMIEYLKHHIPIIIKYEDCGWCNANIYFENGTLIVKPDYNMPFDD